MSSPSGSHGNHFGHGHNLEIVYVGSQPGDTISGAASDTVTGADTIVGFGQTPVDRPLPQAGDSVLASATRDAAGDTVIHFGDGASITLVGVDAWPSALFKTH